MLASAISSGRRLHKYQFNVLILYGFIFPFWQTAAAFSPQPAARIKTGSGSPCVMTTPGSGVVFEEAFLCH
ncbi:hypothetical protein [Aeromonas caviae]|uniref:hypothetical protein n=1 Tax=Aeromonas caviae TaxID=648 RepID=UPI002B4776FA|nr:hypothetical protein [Aeromonas caviae]